MNVQELLAKASVYLPPEDLSRIEEAYRFALEAHDGQLRKSGGPYVEHSVQASIIVADLRLDADGIIAALLHDVPEDCGIPLEEIERRFGTEVRNLVDGITKLNIAARRGSGKVEDSIQADNLRKMLIAMSEDIRVVFIKLADRIHNMRTLGPLPPEKRDRIAQETMDIYAPLAHRLGIWRLKQELEDLAFRWLQPDDYHEITNLLEVRKTAWERYIAYASRVLTDEFQKAGMKADISGRPKSIYSIYTKMQKYAEQGREFSEIHDLLAIRVLVDEIHDCYNALGIIHSLWHPLPGQFNDYIANPKGNMYQSLHTTVIALEGKPLEIQIRTHEMHRTSEYGVAAHWRYKEGVKRDLGFEEKLAWFRQLIEWRQDLTGPDLVESLKSDVFKDQVYVFTPMGEIKELPQGATPLDFAYRIHTELGHRCIGAKVNGKLVQLTYQLRNGDVVEILSTKSDRGPSLDWLNPHAGYVKSHQARDKIRQWFRKQERAENLVRGKELFEKELKRLGVSASGIEIAGLFGYHDFNTFLIAIGCGDISAHQIGPKLVPREESVSPPSTPKQPAAPTGIQVLGVGDLLTHLASCCTPVPGDEIVGFVTRTKGVTIHRRNCSNIVAKSETERLIDVSWGQNVRSYPASICVNAYDRVGLIRDITTVVSDNRINITSISNVNHDDATMSVYLVLDITDIGQLSRLFSRLERVKGIISVSRIARYSQV
jgi:GTP pyrophosphokinase